MTHIDVNLIHLDIDRAMDARDYDAALERLYNLASGDPSFEAGYYAYLIGQCLEFQGNVSAALVWYNIAVAENPGITRYAEAQKRLWNVPVEYFVNYKRFDR